MRQETRDFLTDLEKGNQDFQQQAEKELNHLREYMSDPKKILKDLFKDGEYLWNFHHTNIYNANESWNTRNNFKEALFNEVIPYLQEKDKEVHIQRLKSSHYITALEIMLDGESLLRFNIFKRVFGKNYGMGYERYTIPQLNKVIEDREKEIKTHGERLFDTELLKTKPYKYALEHVKRMEKEEGYNIIGKVYYRIANCLTVTSKRKRKTLIEQFEKRNKRTNELIEDVNKEIENIQEIVKKKEERYDKEQKKYAEWKEYFERLGYEEKLEATQDLY